jgi:hypothetical protein
MEKQLHFELQLWSSFPILTVTLRLTHAVGPENPLLSSCLGVHEFGRKMKIETSTSFSSGIHHCYRDESPISFTTDTIADGHSYQQSTSGS